MIQIKCNLSLDEFVAEAEPLLLKKEACNNLMLGILNHFKEVKHTAIVSEGNYGIAFSGDEAVFAFMQTPPKKWIFAAGDAVSDAVIQEVVIEMKRNRLDVPGVIGPTKEVDVFVAQWEKEQSQAAHLHMKQLIYQLDRVKSISLASGHLERATRAHESIIADWLFQFGKETVEDISAEKAMEMAASYIEVGSAYVWMDNQTPVSMVNRSRKTQNGATVNAVYTPDEYKRKGYATSAVATLSQKILDDGFGFCSLYTDMLNPTSNNIYKRIGYYEVGTSIVYTFKQGR